MASDLFFRLAHLSVSATTCVGYHMAPGPFNLPFFALTSLGVSGTIASANSINQVRLMYSDRLTTHYGYLLTVIAS